ncbi:MAG: hypothetical protein AAF415_18310 [Pseudomonadota bacterium]
MKPLVPILLSALLAVPIGAVIASPAAADGAGVRVAVGGGNGVSVTAGGKVGGFRGKFTYRSGGRYDRYRGRHFGRPGFPYGYGHKPFVPFIGYSTQPYLSDWDRRRAQRPVVPPPPQNLPDEAELDPQTPPDPRGPRFAPARGIAAEQPEIVIGGPLPFGQPHVALDWRKYDLPEPAARESYIRVGRDVLVIDTVTRLVLRRAETG